VPAGAFYAFPNVRGVLRRARLTSRRLARLLLEGYGVACLPGTAFGALGEGYLRFSFATAPAALDEALRRVHACLSDLHDDRRSTDGVSHV
jgi:aspartate/methionine/tyrosine aminotransferase